MAAPAVLFMLRITAPFSDGVVDKTGTPGGSPVPVTEEAPPPQAERAANMSTSSAKAARALSVVFGRAACLASDIGDDLLRG
jgi:hypothetical protein